MTQPSTRTIIVLLSIALLTAFAAGRWSSPEKIKTVVQTVTVEKKTDDKKTDATDHKKYTTIEKTTPDGTKTKTTVITDDRDNTSVDQSTDNIEKTETKSKEVDKSSSKLTMSFLAGVAITAPGVPIYGAAISRPILGPITLGIFGMTNRTAGVSIGLTF